MNIHQIIEKYTDAVMQSNQDRFDSTQDLSSFMIGVLQGHLEAALATMPGAARRRFIDHLEWVTFEKTKTVQHD